VYLYGQGVTVREKGIAYFETINKNSDFMKISRASRNDLQKILDLQKIAFIKEARLYNNYNIQPLTQTMEELKAEYKSKVILKAETDSRIIGSVRADVNESDCWVNKLMVHPDYQGRGTGKALLLEIERYFPQVKKFRLGTGARSKNNIRLYERAGYKVVKYGKFHDGIEAVFMEKTIE
jgi:GNAT superfamily N-acetyltransferase